MKLLQQLLNEMGADSLKSFTVVPGFGGYFRSVKSVLDYSPTKIVLRLGGNAVTAEGENLTIDSYFQGDILIKGMIKVVTVE